MDLRDFIAKTLTDIANGVRDAQNATSSLDVQINRSENPPQGRRERKSIPIKFHIAVSETEGTATSGKIGVLAGIVGAASSGESKAGSTAATTISFEVPMVLPKTPNDPGG